MEHYHSERFFGVEEPPFRIFDFITTADLKEKYYLYKLER